MLRRFCAHASIILSLMYLIFFAIDRVNKAMNFINNELTKYLLVALAVLSIANAIVIIVSDRHERERQWRRQRKERAEKGAKR